MPSSAWHAAHADLHSFPTRRSSDLARIFRGKRILVMLQRCRNARLSRLRAGSLFTSRLRRLLASGLLACRLFARGLFACRLFACGLDRKSTRLNSSHSQISYAVFCLARRPRRSTLFPYTTLFRSRPYFSRKTNSCNAPALSQCPLEPLARGQLVHEPPSPPARVRPARVPLVRARLVRVPPVRVRPRSEEHTSELQSQSNLVCRLLLGTPPTQIYTLSLHDALPISPVFFAENEFL